MKQFTAILALMLSTGILSAQSPKVGASKKPRSGNPAKKVVFGVIKDQRNRPFSNVLAFVYSLDSTILASATTDADGRFETNGVLPGKYFIKLKYPTNVVTLVYGFTIKEDLELNVKMNAPENDTMVAYDVVMPKMPDAKAASKK
jgi:hypothetical protein